MHRTDSNSGSKKSRVSIDDPDKTQRRFFTDNPEALAKLKKRRLKSFAHLYNDWNLDEEVKEYRLAHKEEYEETICRLDEWFIQNKLTFIRQFCNAFKHRRASFSDFKALLKDMDFPATAFQTHMVCLLFDSGLKKGLSLYNFEIRLKVWLKLEEEGDVSVFPHLRDQTCFPNPVERYVNLKLYSLDLLKEPNFRGHAKAFLSVNCTKYELVGVLNDNVDLIYRHYDFYHNEEDARYPNLAMQPDVTLEEFGIVGGPRTQPPTVKLFYMYKKQIVSCPLLRYISHDSIRREFEEFSAFAKERKKFERSNFTYTRTQDDALWDERQKTFSNQ